MLMSPHPESTVRLPDGRSVQFKVHQCLWSGAFPANSIPAIEECYREAVARVEIDVCMLRDADFLVVHEVDLADSTDGEGLVSSIDRGAAGGLHLLHAGRPSEYPPPLLSDVVDLIRDQPHLTLMELDLKDKRSLPWARVEELARIVEPVKDRVTLAGVADWNLRRLLEVDASLPVGWDPNQHFDWLPEDDDEPRSLPRGAYGYLDAHPLARAQSQSVADYVADRLAELLVLVPGLRELHLRLNAFERMLDDGVSEAAEQIHRRGVLLDVWTLDAETPHWQPRLERAVAAGADIVTSNTPRTLASALAPR
jgi:glycerophosphoryl diester phosphodiesterase